MQRMRRWATALVAAALWAGTAATGTPAAAAPPAATGGLTTVGLGGWQVHSTTGVPQAGGEISQPGFAPAGWLAVRPDDAGAPGTEVEALVQNGVCLHDPSFAIHRGPPEDGHDVFFSDNLRRCYGQMTTVGPVTIPEFSVPWWFRADFVAGLRPGQRASLVVNGVVGQADVWVNGVEVATQATVRGAFAATTIDVTDLVRPGTNSLALELYPNDSTAMLTVDNVDWTQIPPDNNTGIQFPIQLHVAGPLAIGDAHVLQSDAPDLSSAALTVQASVSNGAETAQTGTVSATITPPSGGGAPIRVSRTVTVPAGATRTVTFTPSGAPQLTVRRPRVWWPYQMGGQPLYTLSADVSQRGAVADASPPVTFGIRTVSTFLTGPSSLARDGARVFAVNGRPFVVRGGGFSENLFLHYSASDLANQVALIRSMGLNAVRTEGKEMPADFYAQLDRAGILVDAGFQCCDFWQPPGDGSGVTASDYRGMYEASLTIGRRLRDHPSVLNFSWSDNNPIAEQEVVSLQGFAQAGFQEPIISSAEANRSGIAGPSGEKEGPYDWVPPAYWYDSTHTSSNAADNDPTQTNVGGAWSFDSEQSAGQTVPTVDSIQRFLSPADQAALWQSPTAQQYHSNYESSDGSHVGYTFGTLFNLDQAITNRYGAWSSLTRYVQQAQVQNYEDTRAQFEAFIDHWTNGPTPSTGTIYWQLNKGWATLLWDLYNYDYDTAGSYFGAKKANEELHAIYAYDTGGVTLDNLSGVAQPGVSVEARVHDFSGAVVDDQVASGISLPSQGVRAAVLTPRVPATTVPPAPAHTYWVELVVRQRGAVVDRNVYWLSTQKDVVDWTDSQGNPQALTSPTSSGLPQFADLRALQGLPQTAVRAVASDRTAGGQTVTSVTITNPSSSPAVAFFLRADVLRAGTQVVPITWSDDDVTLWPGQSQTLTARYDTSLLGGTAPVVSVSGWNVPSATVPAGADAASVAAQRAVATEAGVEHFGSLDGTPAVSGAADPAQPGAGPGPGAPAPQVGPHVAWRVSARPSTPSFVQGDTSDAYTLTVTNTGTIPTDGTTPVALTDVVDPDLSLVSIAGPGWSCDASNDPTEVCTETGGPGGRPAVLAPGQSYPPITLTAGVSALAGFGSQDSVAGLHVVDAATVAGGAPAQPTGSTAAVTPITGPANLTADDALAGAFRQGDAADRYQVTVVNQGAGATTGPVVAAFQVPAGERPVALYGSGWTCSVAAARCTSSEVVVGENGEAPPITLVVRVASDAPPSLVQKVTVSGGGERVRAQTTAAPTPVLTAPAAVVAPAGVLAVTSAHSGGFAQGDAAGRYTLTVRNTSATTAAQGPVTVTDSLPPGISATRMTGDGWSCSLQPAAPAGPLNSSEPLATCGRSDALTAGASYPPIALTVAVEDGAQPSLTNSVTVAWGGPGPASMTATDQTAVAQRPDLGITIRSSSDGVPYAPFAPGADDAYTITVANAGFAATSGEVTLAVDLPAGLSAVSLSGGADWSCSAAATMCTTRPGVSLPVAAQRSITLRVAVAAGADRSVVPLVQVSGGGEIEPANDFVAPVTYVR
jgi:exo-1,4-beta-D-glucosaminidase